MALEPRVLGQRFQDLAHWVTELPRNEFLAQSLLPQSTALKTVSRLATHKLERPMKSAWRYKNC